MEIAPLFLLLLVPPADATSELASALEASLHSELGDVAMAMAPDRLVTPAMMDGENPPYQARFVAHVTWASRDKAGIEVQSGRELKSATPYRASRVVTFSPRDRKAERGRAMGLVIAGLLRDSPPAVSGSAAALAPPPASPTPKGLAMGGLFYLQRAKSGTWPLGPLLSFDSSLSDLLGLHFSAGFLAGKDCWQVPLAAGARWRFLRSQDDRHGVALGLGAVLLRESVSLSGDDEDGGNASLWNVGAVVGLSGHVTLGQSLRLLAQVEEQALARRMAVQYGEEPVRTTTFSRWRPAFGVGLAYSM